jgi:CubicO group peptidase (beta-lactamase class C family)
MNHKLALLFAGILSLLASAQNGSATEPATKTTQTAFANGELSGLHGVYAKQDGHVVTEVYFAGQDQVWGVPTGVRNHGPQTLHDVRSITKSVVGLLYGIALADGIVPSPESPLFASFDEYSDLAARPDVASITIGHALTMTTGLAWDETTIPYTDRRNSEIAMELSEDRYRFILSQPVEHPPGEVWNYSGGATALIARLIEKSAGESIDTYAARRLFTPLGIDQFEWIKGSDQTASAASGLRLTLPDLLKLGEMVANDGVYGGQQIVTAAWLDEMLKPRTHSIAGLQYGYFWWLAPAGSPTQWVAAFGNGGQRLTVNRANNIVIAITTGNYNQLRYWELPTKLISAFITPALR